MRNQLPNESRLEYMLNVAIVFAEAYGAFTMCYDEAVCDGYCLADDLRDVLNDVKEGSDE